MQNLQALFINMNSKFNKNWKSSKQRRKQRKFLVNAPNHIRRKLIVSHLDKSLKEKYSKRSLELRKGDEVKIMSGEFKNKKGKVLKIDIKNFRVQIEGITRTRKNGEKVPVWFHPSKLKIISIDESDKRRISKLKENKKNVKES